MIIVGKGGLEPPELQNTEFKVHPHNLISDLFRDLTALLENYLVDCWQFNLCLMASGLSLII